MRSARGSHRLHFCAAALPHRCFLLLSATACNNLKGSVKVEGPTSPMTRFELRRCALTTGSSTDAGTDGLSSRMVTDT